MSDQEVGAPEKGEKHNILLRLLPCDYNPSRWPEDLDQSADYVLSWDSPIAPAIDTVPIIIAQNEIVSGGNLIWCVDSMRQIGIIRAGEVYWEARIGMHLAMGTVHELSLSAIHINTAVAHLYSLTSHRHNALARWDRDVRVATIWRSKHNNVTHRRILQPIGVLIYYPS